MTYVWLIVAVVALGVLGAVHGALVRINNALAILATAQLAWLAHSDEPEQLKRAHAELVGAIEESQS